MIGEMELTSTCEGKRSHEPDAIHNVSLRNSVWIPIRQRSASENSAYGLE